MSDHFDKGVALHQLGRHKEAEAEFLQAIAADSNDPEPRVYLAWALLQQDKVSAALESGKAAVALAPDAFQSHYVLAEVLNTAKRYPEAESSIKEALRLNPEASDLHALNATIAMGQKQAEQALVRAKAGLEVNPQSVRCLNMAGAAALNLRRLDEADELLDRALALEPSADFLHVNKAYCATARGDTDRAVEFFIEGLRLNPNSKQTKSALLHALESRNWLYMLLRGLTLFLMLIVSGIGMLLALVFLPFQSVPFLQERLQNPDKPATFAHKLISFLYLPLLIAYPLILLVQLLFALLEMTETGLITLTLLTNPSTSRLVSEGDRKRMKSCLVLWEFLILVCIVCAVVWHNPEEFLRGIRNAHHR